MPGAEGALSFDEMRLYLELRALREPWRRTNR